MIYNEDCIKGSQKHIVDKSVDLMICDPPFGINESSFDKNYNRNSDFVINGYVEAPSDYYQFSLDWLIQAYRCLKDNGSIYVFSSWNNLRQLLNAAHDANFHTINHIIWKYNFGVHTKKRYVGSYYTILYLKKSESAQPKFNTYCRFGPMEKDENGKSLNYRDLEDVFIINREYQPNTVKNNNKLPEKLVQKLIQYSSDPNDIVCDFFLGNFTTAIVAKKLGRIPWGFELNPSAFEIFSQVLDNVENGCELLNLRQVNLESPPNQGKPVSEEERLNITNDFVTMIAEGDTKKAAIQRLCDKYGRGRFSIQNIIKGK